MKAEIFNKIANKGIDEAKKILVENGYCEYFMKIVECEGGTILKVRDNYNTVTSLYDFGNGVEKKITYKI